MRVLLPIIYHDLTECIARAFTEQGHEVRVVDLVTRKKKDRRSADAFIIEEAHAFRPDLAFCQFQRPDVITVNTPKALKEIDCFSVNWSGDVRHPLPDWYLDLAPLFDVTSFTNHTDVDIVKAHGFRSEFLQIGYCERTFNTDGAGNRSGVVFLGNNYPDGRFTETEGRREMVAALSKEFGSDFTVYGRGWEGIALPESLGGVMVEKMSAPTLQRALVAVGYDHFHRPGFASDRLLRATACGCATINQHYDGVETEHPDVVAVKSIDEMVEAVRHALAHPVESEMIGQLCAQNTLKQHRWNERVKRIETWMQ